MAATSAVEIMNSALIKLGAERIITPDDANLRARLVKEQYPKVRDALMRSHPWRFSTGYKALAAIDPMPADIFGYSYAFQLPADCSRVFNTNLDSMSDWEESESMLLCNESSVSVRYSKRVADVTKFDDSFCEVLAYALAADIAFALTQSVSRAEDAEKKFRYELAQARSQSAQVGSVKRVISDDWLSTRRRG